MNRVTARQSLVGFLMSRDYEIMRE